MTAPNTRISYLYRDGANYKEGAVEIVAGQVTFGQIRPYLDDDRLFIASQVGLTDPHDGMALSPEYDHVYVEICERDFQPSCEHPTIPLTAEQLIENFRTAGEHGWDEKAAKERLKFSVSQE